MVKLNHCRLMKQGTRTATSYGSKEDGSIIELHSLPLMAMDAPFLILRSTVLPL